MRSTPRSSAFRSPARATRTKSRSPALFTTQSTNLLTCGCWAALLTIKARPSTPPAYTSQGMVAYFFRLGKTGNSSCRQPAKVIVADHKVKGSSRPPGLRVCRPVTYPYIFVIFVYFVLVVRQNGHRVMNYELNEINIGIDMGPTVAQRVRKKRNIRIDVITVSRRSKLTN